MSIYNHRRQGSWYRSCLLVRLLDIRAKVGAKSYKVGTGQWHYPPNSCQPPTKQPLKISYKSLIRSKVNQTFTQYILLDRPLSAAQMGTYNQKETNTPLLNFNFMNRVYFINSSAILKNHFLRVPALITLIGPKSKILFLNFVFLVEHFSKWYDTT